MNGIVSCIAFILLLVPCSLRAQLLRFDVTPDKESFVVGEPIILHCVFRNDSDLPAQVDLGTNDAQNVAVIVNPQLKGEKLPFRIRRGGMALPGDFKVEPHQSVSRYELLDYWFRPDKAGTYPLKLFVEWKSGTLESSCEVKVIEGGTEGLIKGVDWQAGRYRELRATSATAKTETRWREFFSFRLALEFYFTYLGEASNPEWPRIREELRRRHEGDHSGWLDMLEYATAMGPGGRAIVD